MKLMKTCLALAIMLTSFAFVNEAEAQRRLVIQNDTNETIYVAYSFLNQHNVWERRGWQEIRAKSPLRYTLNSNNNTMYVYARSKSREWQGYEGDPNSIWLTVVNRNFVVKGKANPSGPGQRQVLFDALIIESGTDFNVTYYANQSHD